MVEDLKNSPIQDTNGNPRKWWFAIGVGVFLLAGLFFYANLNERPSEDLSQRNGEETVNAEAALEEAASRLGALQARMETEPVSQDMIDEVVDIRRNLAAAYAQESVEVRLLWQQFDEELENFEMSLRESIRTE